MEGGHGLHRMSAADRGGASLGQAEMLDLALSDQVTDCAHDILDRRIGIDTVLVEEIDRIGTKPPERRLDDLANVCGLAREAVAHMRLRIDIEPEFGGDHHLVADKPHSLTDQLFVGERPVDLGSIEEGHAAIDGVAHQLDHCALVLGCAVVDAHAHTAEAEGGDGQAAAAEFAKSS